MRVGICAVGSELAFGAVLDRNSAWLAARVAESGCTISAAMIVGDDRGRLVDALDWLAARSDVLVVGGGLGPTADDVTRDAVATFAGARLERRDDLVAHLERVYQRLDRVMPPEALRQADVPPAAEVHPPLGTAAGFALDLDHNGRHVRLHALPGVPWEFRGTADDVILPELVSRSGGRARITRTLHVAGLGESGVGARLMALSDRLGAARGRPADDEHGIELGFLANSDEVLVKISADGPSPKAAHERAAPLVAEAVELLGDAVTSVDDQRLEDVVVRQLELLGERVATAEGVTAGRVAAAISTVPASSQVLAGGLVAYDTPTLADFLGADAGLLDQHGTISTQVVGAMARTARRRFGTDYAVATMGVTTEAECPTGHRVGDAVWAIATPDGAVQVEQRYIPAADRDVIQVRGAAFALESLRRQLLARRGGAASSAVTP